MIANDQIQSTDRTRPPAALNPLPGLHAMGAGLLHPTQTKRNIRSQAEAEPAKQAPTQT
jgi:hypothetical protein